MLDLLLYHTKCNFQLLNHKLEALARLKKHLHILISLLALQSLHEIELHLSQVDLLIIGASFFVITIHIGQIWRLEMIIEVVHYHVLELLERVIIEEYLPL